MNTSTCLIRFAATVYMSGIFFFFSAPTFGQEDGEALVEQARCYMCHQVTETSLGPPYVAIAARHAANKALMTDVLATKIVQGGGGNWGWVPMVPNQWVSIEEARIMADWILNLPANQ